MKKKRIAYITRQMDDTVANPIWAGVVNGAKIMDVDLIAFVGGILGKDDKNIMYQFCNKNNFDGIITWATSDTDFLDYFSRFKGIPLVSLSLEIPGFPCISIDSYSGMKDAITHLIKEHGFRKIAFIRGPLHHIYAQQRFQAYIDTHKEFNIQIDERKISPPGNWEAQSGINAITYFLVQNKLTIPDDIEAIVGANDYLVIGAAEELKRRGYKIPKDVRIIGFNNTPDAEAFTPPVTSVAMPYFEQGELAVRTICDLIDGRPVEKKIVLKSSLVVERSCGCKHEFINDVATDIGLIKFEKCLIEKLKIKGKIKLKEEKEKTFNDIKEKVIQKITEKVLFFLRSRNEITKDLEEIINTLSRRFVEAFIESINKKDSETFLNTIEEILLFLSEYECNVDAWHAAISILRESFNSVNRIIELYLLSEDYFEQARILVSEVVKRVHISRNLKDNKKLQRIRELGSKLITSFEFDKLFNILIDGLRNLDFPSYYVVLYEKPFKYSFPDPLPEKGKLVIAITNGKILLKNSEEWFNPIEIIPEKYKTEKNRILVCLPIIFEKRQMGYLVLEVGPIEKYIYSAITEQLSSALMGSFLMWERKETEGFLEETLNSLQQKAKIVAENSNKINQRIDDISAAVEQIAANIRQISTRSEEVFKVVKDAVRIVKEANGIIFSLNEKTDKISDIISIINDIAEKTNILALNANIEAARAREYGKGFKVVANEIKKLSLLTVKSTEEIKAAITGIQLGSRNSSDAIVAALNMINRVFEFTDAIKEAVNQQVIATNDVANKLIEANYGSKEIFEAIKEIANIEEEETKDDTIASKIKKLKEEKSN